MPNNLNHKTQYQPCQDGNATTGTRNTHHKEVENNSTNKSDHSHDNMNNGHDEKAGVVVLDNFFQFRVFFGLE